MFSSKAIFINISASSSPFFGHEARFTPLSQVTNLLKILINLAFEKSLNHFEVRMVRENKLGIIFSRLVKVCNFAVCKRVND